jgi:colanic acid/amylovoran biosynthesis glycosyltransferase
MSRPEAEQAAPRRQADGGSIPPTWRALNVSRYGAESRNLILGNLRANAAVSGGCVYRPLWSGGVTAAKLRELGVIDGKIATIFHGIDIPAVKC